MKIVQIFEKSHEKSQKLKSCTGAHRRERLRAKILVGNIFRGPRGPN